jgi:hypothetical protein
MEALRIAALRCRMKHKRDLESEQKGPMGFGMVGDKRAGGAESAVDGAKRDLISCQKRPNNIRHTDKQAGGAERTGDGAQICMQASAGKLTWGEVVGGEGQVVEAAKNLCRVLNTLGLGFFRNAGGGGEGER